MLMKVLTLALALSCLASFSWARRKFFARKEGATRHRRGLAPLGTFFGLLVIVLIVREEIGAFWLERSLIGSLCFLVSLTLFWWSIKSHAGERPLIAFTSGAPIGLVTGGSYRIIRHPFYSAYAMFWIGCAVVSWSYIGLVPIVVMGALYYGAAKEEEKYILASTLGESYKNYSKTSGMFLPKMHVRTVFGRKRNH